MGRRKDREFLPPKFTDCVTLISPFHPPGPSCKKGVQSLHYVQSIAQGLGELVQDRNPSLWGLHSGRGESH